MKIIGLMSGTSVDGVDAALVQCDSQHQLSVIQTCFTPYPNSLKREINSLAQNKDELAQSALDKLDEKLASFYSICSLNLLKQSNFKKNEITAIANHGQTIRHAPYATPPYSIQLGNPQSIASQTGIPTIGYFRQADLVSGGQGAPLMPAFHHAIFQRPNSAVINIGGIANITLLEEPVLGYDTGPGNTLLDQWINQHKHLTFDKNGDWAKTGNSITSILNNLLDDPYFKTHAPKSTGPDYFNLAWLTSKIENINQFKPEDIQATLLTLTVESIAQNIETYHSKIDHIYICGGGAHNQHLMSSLKTRLPSLEITTTEVLGIPADWVEAVGFAWLGYCYLHNIPSNLPSVTGAKKAVVLGEINHPIKPN